MSLANLVLPAILSYALLSCLLVFVPLISGGLRHLALVLFIAPTQVGLPIRAALQAGIQSALVWVWTQIVPTLIRPLFTWGGRVPAADWSGKLPPPQAIAPLQHLGWILVCLAALLGALRVALESRAWSHPAVVRGTQQLRAAILEAAGGRKKVRPGWTTSAFKAALITFMLAGLLSSWMEAVVLMAAIVAIMELPSLLRARAAGWFNWVSRVPLVYRLGGGGAFSFAIGAGVAALMWGKTATFLPVLIATLFSLLVFALVVPDQPTAAARRARVHGQAEGGRGVSRSMYGPLISIGAAAVVLLGAREAYADNCGSLIDCYNTVASAGVVAAAIAVAVAIAAIAGPIIVDAAAGIGGEYIAVRARAQRDLGVQEIHSGDLAVHGGAGILKGPDVRLRSGGGGASHSVASEDLLETEERSDHV